MLSTTHRFFGYTLAFAICAFAFSTLAACGGSRHSAPTLPNGQRLAVMVFLDRTAPPETPPERIQQMQQVSDWMEPDLLAVLRANGYDAASATSVDGGGSAPGRYTLRVQIVEYSAGNMAVRRFVGWGAGKARLATSFELLGPNGASYVTGTPAAATGRTDWRRTVRKVDEEIVAAVNVRLGQGL
ncbi:MAG: hypothetical protein RL701_6237 [Pseudomonadota bacterium]|jgi:hypothetical protein